MWVEFHFIQGICGISASWGIWAKIPQIINWDIKKLNQNV